MKSDPLIFCCWPDPPPLPLPRQPVLVCVPTHASRSLARSELRNVLRKILGTWTQLSSEKILLQETWRGPVWPGELGGHTLDISLAYGKTEGWIGLRRHGWIGVDAVALEFIAEAPEVARHYLGPAISENIRQSPEPAGAFAVAWSDLEARLKCLKSGLTEWSVEHSNYLTRCRGEHLFFPKSVVAIATA